MGAMGKRRHAYATKFRLSREQRECHEATSVYRRIYLAQAQPQMLATWAAETRHLKKCGCRVLPCLRGYTSCRFRNA